MRPHPLAWTIWLASVAAFAFAVSNPLFLGLAVGAVLAVHIARPPDASAAGRAVRTFVALGVGLLAVRVVLVALVPNPGHTILFAVPRVTLPAWMGRFSLGGPVTEEILVESGAEGLRLVLVLAAFGVFNAAVDLPGLMRMVPSAFRDAGLVMSIALAFVPGLMQTARDVHDAQVLRGDRGWRRLAPSLAVPILGMSLERAFLLAESMDARGYGGAAASSRAGRALTLAGLAAVLGGVAVWVSGAPRAGTALVAAGAASLAWAVRSVGRSGRETRLGAARWRLGDAPAAILPLGALAAAISPASAYTAYPVAHVPGFSAWGLAALLLAAPMVWGGGA